MNVIDLFEFAIRFFSGMVAISGHPVLSVFYLVAACFLSAVLLLSMGFEFMGLMLVIIYMGALAVLFLFVVIMLELKVYGGTSDYTGYVHPYSLIFFLLILSSMYFDSTLVQTAHIDGLNQLQLFGSQNQPSYVMTMDTLVGSATLGALLYTHYWHMYLIAGIVLLIALMGSSVLTRQEPFKVSN
jgi:NADH-quinone oxidoreductase subunit J